MKYEAWLDTRTTALLTTPENRAKLFMTKIWNDWNKKLFEFEAENIDEAEKIFNKKMEEEYSDEAWEKLITKRNRAFGGTNFKNKYR